MTLYEDLGVPPDASIDAIIAAYRRQAKEHHPDAGGDPVEFARIQRAADILRDAEKRARYDATGAIDEQPENDQAAAVNVLCDVFRQVRHQNRENMQYVDLARQMRAGINQLQENVKTERARIEDEQRVNAEARQRLRHRGKGGDFIRAMLEEEEAKLAKSLTLLDHRDQVIQSALEMAKEYDWIIDLDNLDAVFLPGSTTWSGAASSLPRR